MSEATRAIEDPGVLIVLRKGRDTTGTEELVTVLFTTAHQPVIEPQHLRAAKNREGAGIMGFSVSFRDCVLIRRVISNQNNLLVDTR